MVISMATKTLTNHIQFHDVGTTRIIAQEIYRVCTVSISVLTHVGKHV